MQSQQLPLGLSICQSAPSLPHSQSALNRKKVPRASLSPGPAGLGVLRDLASFTRRGGTVCLLHLLCAQVQHCVCSERAHGWLIYQEVEGEQLNSGTEPRTASYHPSFLHMTERSIRDTVQSLINCTRSLDFYKFKPHAIISKERETRS